MGRLKRRKIDPLSSELSLRRAGRDGSLSEEKSGKNHDELKKAKVNRGRCCEKGPPCKGRGGGDTLQKFQGPEETIDA